MKENIAPDSVKSKEYEFLYSSLVAIRNTELSIYWTRYSILSAINFGIIAVALTAGNNSTIHAARTWISLGGILIASIWLLITVRGKHLLTERWDRNIEIFEQKCIDDPELKLFTRVLKSESKNRFIKNWDNLNILAWSLPVLCIIAWIVFSLR